jgi:type II secretory pathway component GspD/PulD (secretin)
MKVKQYMLALVGLVAWSLAAVAQTTPPAGELHASTASVTNNADGAQPAAEAKDAPAAEPAAQPTGTDTTNTPQATPVTNAPAADAAAVTNTPATDAAAVTNATAQATGTNAAVITLITMDDVPLTDAIKNLARQAGLNYILDPKVTFGQVGPDGKTPLPQPSVSIRWENVTAEQALTALLGTYNLQLVEDPKSKIARITIRDPAAPDPLVTKIIQLKFASPTNIMSAIQNTLTDKRSKVVPDVRTSQLVVLATEKELVDVDELVARLDTQTRQVLIESRLLETSINPSTVKGIDWAGTLAAQHVTFGNNLQLKPVPQDSVQPPLSDLFSRLIMSPSAGSFFAPPMTFLNADGVSALLSFLNTYAETKVISAPRTVTLDNELATIEVGTMYPIVNVTPGTVQVSGGSQISYSNLTVRLDVTPRISANNYINLKVSPRILRLGDLVRSTVANQVNLINSFQKRELVTSVLIPSGNTLVMGGLIEDNVHNENSKVPILGDIPGLGLLFRHDFKNRTKSNLIVFLTPTIIQDEDFQPTKTDFLKTPVPVHDSIEPDWGSWDSGKPHDWSKPKPSAGSGQATADKFAAVPEKAN